ncbi:glycosyltransferase family 2 protein [Neolewinella lacunae]|uniref:Glycosyltransferase n=1 Tax=Neolewinella lacunae TaxID=1517758 RepID=A0A923PHH0_9BACT|nr:glycosyltransferase family 2 protein [Neolewinella lacunae]MBC6994157.1 glycosyltransferase [Neolewinella lacunae]MDN3636694.1 glycosyltransferase family 2 protein [Neolewinella lacunae]
MTISIITATYNSAATLADTLDSLLAQQWPGLEVILQDGGSTDATLEIAARYPFVRIESVRDGGLYDAMNRGIARATGEVIGILNSDDFYPSPQVLHWVAEVFARRPEVDALYGDLVYVAAERTERVVRRWIARQYDHAAWRWGWMPPHPTFFVRRHVYERYGSFQTDLRLAADYEFMLRCCYRHGIKVVYLPRVLVHMRVGGVSNKSLANRLAANREDRRAWELNGLQPPAALALLKPLRKVKQWLRAWR